MQARYTVLGTDASSIFSEGLLQRVGEDAKRAALQGLEDWWEQDGEPTESDVESFLDAQFKSFIADFKDHASLQSTGVTGYRFISGTSGELNLDHIGIFWSYDKSGSENYSKAYPAGHTNSWVIAIIPWSSIDIEQTLLLGLHPAARHVNERELRLKPNHPLEIIKINDKSASQKVHSSV